MASLGFDEVSAEHAASGSQVFLEDLRSGATAQQPPSPSRNGAVSPSGPKSKLRSIRLCEFAPEDTTASAPSGSPLLAKTPMPTSAQRWAQQRIASLRTQLRAQRAATSVASFAAQPDRVSAVEVLERWGALRFGGDADTPASLSPSEAHTTATNTTTAQAGAAAQTAAATTATNTAPNAKRRASSAAVTSFSESQQQDALPSAVPFEMVAPVQTLIDRAILLEKGEALPPEVEAARLRRALAALLADLQQQAVHASQRSGSDPTTSLSQSPSTSMSQQQQSRGPLCVSTQRTPKGMSGILRTASSLSTGHRGTTPSVPFTLTSGNSAVINGLPMLQINDGASSDGSVRSRNSVQMAYVTANACVEEDPDDPGFTTLNQYVLLDALGAGAQGEVFLATDTEKNELRAIKAVPRPAGLVAGSPAAAGAPMKAARQRRLEDLQREVAIMKRCRHRNVVALYEVIDDPTQDTMYLVMQYVEHGPIASVLQDGSVSRTIEPVLLARYARQICAGLEYLHRHGVVHRDIKPENILLGQNEQVCLADFGVSDALEPGRQRRLVVSGTRGTAAFIAPELLCDKSSTQPPEQDSDRPGSASSASSRASPAAVDGPAVDVWALGVTLFALLYGKLPWEFEDARDLFNKIQDQPIELRPLRGNGDLAPGARDAVSPGIAALSSPGLGASISTLIRSQSRSQNDETPNSGVHPLPQMLSTQLDSDEDDAFSITTFPAAAADIAAASGSMLPDKGLGPRQTTAAYIASPWVDPVDQKWRKLLAGMLHYDPAKRLKLRDVRRHVLQILQAAQAKAVAAGPKEEGSRSAEALRIDAKPQPTVPVAEAITPLRRV